MKGIMRGLSKNGTLANGHEVMMKTAFRRGSKVAFGSLSFFTLPSLLLGKDAKNQLLSEIRQITKEDVWYDHILIKESWFSATEIHSGSQDLAFIGRMWKFTEVSVSYCCKTNHSKLSGLKKSIYLVLPIYLRLCVHQVVMLL